MASSSSQKVPAPKKRTVADLKNSILNTALTTHYECNFHPPQAVQNLYKKWYSSLTELIPGATNPALDEYYTLACAEASLPGTSLATVELQNDHSGITERHVHRRQYDNTASFTFYVDTSYRVIKLFETWIGYIVNDQQSASPDYFYRVNFPAGTMGYQTSIFISKFERNYSVGQPTGMNRALSGALDALTGNILDLDKRGSSGWREERVLRYEYLNAYPVSIDAMPVSYDGAQLLKCTVNFNFSRYILLNEIKPPDLKYPIDENSSVISTRTGVAAAKVD